MIVLGIDPGLSRCGYGCIKHGRKPIAIGAGVIQTNPKLDTSLRLAEIQSDISATFKGFSPDVVAIERLMFSKNTKTAMSVAMATGVVLAEAGVAKCEVFEYSPSEVKLTVAGAGKATKQEIGEMVSKLLGLGKALKPVDAADALAIALCHVATLPPPRAAGALQ